MGAGSWHSQTYRARAKATVTVSYADGGQATISRDRGRGQAHCLMTVAYFALALSCMSDHANTLHPMQATLWR